jgi:hypothetical protein
MGENMVMVTKELDSGTTSRVRRDAPAVARRLELPRPSQLVSIGSSSRQIDGNERPESGIR